MSLYRKCFVQVANNLGFRSIKLFSQVNENIHNIYTHIYICSYNYVAYIHVDLFRCTNLYASIQIIFKCMHEMFVI